MSERRKVVYCWDTSVFLAWINEENGAPLADIQLIAEEIESGKAVLVVPVTIATEVLGSKMSPTQRNKFELFLKRPEVVVAETTLAIARKAGAIRDEGLLRNPKLKVKTPDATIVATAIIYQCDALHSLDKRGSGPLKLTDLPSVKGLKICKPVLVSGQKGLEY